MKKILLAISSLFLLAGCNTYTVKFEQSTGDRKVTINGEEFKPKDVGYCKEYSDSFFGLAGDFPLKIKTWTSDNVKEKQANHYLVSANGEIFDEDTGCTKNDPDTTKPDNTKPDNTKPDTTKPDNTKPDNTKPDNTKPDNTKPDNTKPDNTDDFEGEYLQPGT